QRGDLARAVVGRRDLDDVEAGEIDPGQGPDEVDRLGRARAADLGRTGRRSEGGVEEVDVEAEERRTPADPIANAAAVLRGRDRVVAAQDKRGRAGAHGLSELPGDLADRPLRVARGDHGVAPVDYTLTLEHVDGVNRVERAQQDRSRANRLGPEAGAGAVTSA